MISSLETEYAYNILDTPSFPLSERHHPNIRYRLRIQNRCEPKVFTTKVLSDEARRIRYHGRELVFRDNDTEERQELCDLLSAERVRVCERRCTWMYD